MAMVMSLKMKHRSHRYGINRPRPRHRHKYTKDKMCLRITMVIRIKQHLLRINTETELKKLLLIKILNKKDSS